MDRCQPAAGRRCGPSPSSCARRRRSVPAAHPTLLRPPRHPQPGPPMPTTRRPPLRSAVRRWPLVRSHQVPTTGPAQWPYRSRRLRRAPPRWRAGWCAAGRGPPRRGWRSWRTRRRRRTTASPPATRRTAPHLRRSAAARRRPHHRAGSRRPAPSRRARAGWPPGPVVTRPVWAIAGQRTPRGRNCTLMRGPTGRAVLGMA